MSQEEMSVKFIFFQFSFVGVVLEVKGVEALLIWPWGFILIILFLIFFILSIFCLNFNITL
jgi:hypothetical protein